MRPTKQTRSANFASELEKSISHVLGSILEPLGVGDSIALTDEFRDVQSGLEYFLPTVLVEIHNEWERESFDGFLFDVAHKVAPREAEFIGFCILISDQTLTPIHLRLQLSPFQDRIVWLELKLGSRDVTGRMTRIPYNSPTVPKKRYLTMSSINEIDWVYHVGFGEKANNDACK